MKAQHVAQVLESAAAANPGSTALIATIARATFTDANHARILANLLAAIEKPVEKVAEKPVAKPKTAPAPVAAADDLDARIEAALARAFPHVFGEAEKPVAAPKSPKANTKKVQPKAEVHREPAPVGFTHHEVVRPIDHLHCPCNNVDGRPCGATAEGGGLKRNGFCTSHGGSDVEGRGQLAKKRRKV